MTHLEKNTGCGRVHSTPAETVRTPPVIHIYHFSTTDVNCETYSGAIRCIEPQPISIRDSCSTPSIDSTHLSKRLFDRKWNSPERPNKIQIAP